MQPTCFKLRKFSEPRVIQALEGNFLTLQPEPVVLSDHSSKMLIPNMQDSKASENSPRGLKQKTVILSKNFQEGIVRITTNHTFVDSTGTLGQVPLTSKSSKILVAKIKRSWLV